MANTYLSRTFGTPTNASKFTISVWVKRSALGTAWNIILASYASSTQYSNLAINGNDQFAWHIVNSSEVSKLYSSRLLRDVNGWYHLVFNWDSTQATASNRTKMYVNGEQITSYSTQTNSAQNTNYNMNTAVTHWIGAEKGNPGGSFGNYFNGSMSHYHFIDGTIYDPTAFGETDSTTGEWKIKTSPSVTYGNNGFFILKDGNTITDQSSGSNDWSLVGGTLTKTEDCPSNVFATYNPLFHACGNLNFYNGNTLIEGTGSDTWTNRWGVSTLGMTGGKFYWEVEVDNDGGGNLYPIGFIKNIDDTAITTSLGGQTNGTGVYADGQNIYNGGSAVQSSLGAITDGDIMACALDTENGTAQFYLNGSTYGTQITGLDTTAVYHAMSNFYGNGNTLKANFGNGYFGTTAVSSAGANASGIGIFEYDVPTGYTALSTKGLNL